MATYSFACDKCMIKWDVKLSFSEHSIMKDKIRCPQCDDIAYQTIVPQLFKLVGEGWFGKNSDAVASPYGITQMEINKNLDNEKKVEDVANNYSYKNPEG